MKEVALTSHHKKSFQSALLSPEEMATIKVCCMTNVPVQVLILAQIKRRLLQPHTVKRFSVNTHPTQNDAFLTARDGVCVHVMCHEVTKGGACALDLWEETVYNHWAIPVNKDTPLLRNSVTNFILWTTGKIGLDGITFGNFIHSRRH